MKKENEELIVVDNEELAFTDIEEVKQPQGLMTTEKALEMATMLSKSTIVPISYQNRPENCYIALEMAQRMNAPVMMVMQNLYMVQGKPSWSGSACASMIQNNPKFTDVELVYVGKEGTDDWGAYVKAVNKKTGKEVKSATVTIKTAKAEGWYGKSGSKWQTMPEQMLAYRAYSWFSRVYCPETMMGLQTAEEVEDVGGVVGTSTVPNPYNK